MAGQTVVAILAYHSIAAKTTPAFASLTVDPSLFAEHLEAMVASNLPAITFAEVPSSLASGQCAVAITIDDGLADCALNAAPRLLRRGLSATFFVPSGYVGCESRWLRGADAERRMLSWRDIGELSAAGFEIGSHGRLHLAADVNAFDMVAQDLRRSRAELEDDIGRPVLSYAYPFGYHSAASRRAVEEAGFHQACVVTDLPALVGDDVLALPRLLIGPSMTAAALLGELTRVPSRMTRDWVHFKQGVWRAGRRWAAWGPPESGPVRAQSG